MVKLFTLLFCCMLAFAAGIYTYARVSQLFSFTTMFFQPPSSGADPSQFYDYLEKLGDDIHKKLRKETDDKFSHLTTALVGLQDELRALKTTAAAAPVSQGRPYDPERSERAWDFCRAGVTAIQVSDAGDALGEEGRTLARWSPARFFLSLCERESLLAGDTDQANAAKQVWRDMSPFYAQAAIAAQKRQNFVERAFDNGNPQAQLIRAWNPGAADPSAGQQTQRTFRAPVQIPNVQELPPRYAQESSSRNRSPRSSPAITETETDTE